MSAGVLLTESNVKGQVIEPANDDGGEDPDRAVSCCGVVSQPGGAVSS